MAAKEYQLKKKDNKPVGKIFFSILVLAAAAVFFLNRDFSARQGEKEINYLPESKTENLRQRVEAAESRNQSLRDSYETFKGLYQKAIEKIRQIESERERILAEKEKLEKDLTGREELLSRVKLQNREVEAKLEELSSELAAYRNQEVIKSYREKIEENSRILTEKAKRIERLNEENKRINQERNILEDAYGRQQDNLKNAERELSLLKQEHQERLRQVKTQSQGEKEAKEYYQEELARQERSFQQDLAQVKDEAEKVKADFEQKLNQMEKANLLLESEREEKARLAAELDKEVSRLKNELTSKKELLADTEDFLRQAKAENQEIIDDKNIFRRANTLMERKIQENEERIQKLLVRNKEIEAINQELTRDKETLAQINKESQEKLSSQESYIRGLEEERAGLRRENQVFQIELAEASQNIADLQRFKDENLKELTRLHYNLGVLFSDRGDYARAVQEYEKVLEIEPDDIYTRYNLGVIYAEFLDDPDKAAAHFNKYLSLAPDDEYADAARRFLIIREAEGAVRID